MNIDKNIQEVPIEDIIPNRFQPRLQFNEEGITELAESIKQHGIIQPLVVRRLGDKFEIIAGERRYKASTMAGLTKVPVIISDIDDNQSAEVALVENIQRRNLTAIEEAKSYKNLLDRGYLTQEQLANKMGVSQSTIANKLRLLNLDEEVQEALLNEKISERHARALLSLEEKEDQRKWLKRIIEERMTVRQLDLQLKKLKENGDEEEGIPLVDINPNIDEIVNNAEDINVIREPHDVASMLIPEGGVIAPAPTKEELEKPAKMPNKFFNFLEDEQANMNVIEPEEILNTFNTEVAPIKATTEISTEEEDTGISTSIEPSFKDATQEFSFTQNSVEETPIQPIMENPVNPVENIVEPVIEAPEATPNNVELLEELEIEEPIQEETANNEMFSPFANIFSESNVNIPEAEKINNEPEEVKTPLEETPVVPIIEPNIISEITPIEEQKEPVMNVETETTPVIEPISEDNVIETITLEDEPIKEPIMTEETNNSTEPIDNNIADNEIMTNEPIVEPVINNEEITPFKSIFFNTEEEDDDTPASVEPMINNTIEEVKPVVEEPIVDPLDSIVKLEPDYEEKLQELAGTDLKTAINLVRDTVTDLENRGFVVELEEADLEDLYHITIKINKDNNNNQK